MKKRHAGKKLAGFLATILVMGAVGLLGSCSRGAAGTPEVQKEAVSYTKPQIMVIAMTERNRYEQSYTDKIWDAIMEDGSTFEEYLLNQVRIFMENMKTMTILAQEQGIVLNSKEQDRVRRLAKNYYSGLSGEEIKYLGISEEDVVVLYQDYYIANKVVEELTKGMDLEVSDSEAKVITIRQVQLQDQETALALYERLQGEGIDFSAVVRDVTRTSPQERQIGRGEEPAVLEEAAFGLEKGQISSLIELDGSYYILQCVSDYDVDATEERKAEIYKERKNWAFQQIYEQFQTEHKASVPDEIWLEINFEGGEEVVTTDFFFLYQEEFGNQGY